MSEYGLNFVFFLDVRVDIVCSFGLLVLELAKVLDVIDIIGYLSTPTGHTDLITRRSTLLLLLGSRTIFRIGVGRRGVPRRSCEGNMRLNVRTRGPTRDNYL